MARRPRRAGGGAHLARELPLDRERSRPDRLTRGPRGARRHRARAPRDHWREVGAMGAIEHPPIVTVPGVPDHVLYTWLAMAVLIVLSFVATRHLELVPRGLQNFVEVVLEQVLALLDDVIG